MSTLPQSVPQAATDDAILPGNAEREIDGSVKADGMGGVDWMESIAIFTHEVRNQLTPLTASLSLLVATEDPAAFVRAVSTMTRKLDVIRRLIVDLQREQGARGDLPSLEFGRVDVRTALASAADHMAALVAIREQTLIVVAPDEAASVDADEQRLDQLLCNLLSNASKFTQVGGWIQIGASVEDSTLVIRVEDNGCGIHADALPRVFDLFNREDRIGAPAGLGVGLAVVKRIAELHGGCVDGQSAGPRAGSVFTVRLPMRQS